MITQNEIKKELEAKKLNEAFEELRKWNKKISEKKEEDDKKELKGKELEYEIKHNYLLSEEDKCFTTKKAAEKYIERGQNMTVEEFWDWLTKRFNQYSAEKPHSQDFYIAGNGDYSFDIYLGGYDDNGALVFDYIDNTYNIHYRFEHKTVCTMFVLKEGMRCEKVQQFIESLL